MTHLPRGDATEMPVGGVTVPKTVQKPPSPRGDATEMPVGRVPVPKTGRRPPEEPTADPNRGVSGEALPVDVLDDQTGKSHPENGGDVSQGTVDLSLFRNLVRDNLLLVV